VPGMGGGAGAVEAFECDEHNCLRYLVTIPL